MRFQWINSQNKHGSAGLTQTRVLASLPE